MTVDTKELVSLKDGLATCSRSTAMRFSAVLSRTTTASALRVSLLSVSSELYGCTTTSLVSFWLGNTLQQKNVCEPAAECFDNSACFVTNGVHSAVTQLVRALGSVGRP